MMNPFSLIYRTLDNTQDYKFLFARQPDKTLRIYVLHQPPYCGRRETGLVTHRHWHERRGLFYIHQQLRTRSIDQALRVAKQWAEATERYRKYGIHFNSGTH